MATSIIKIIFFLRQQFLKEFEAVSAKSMFAKCTHCLSNYYWGHFVLPYDVEVNVVTIFSM